MFTENVFQSYLIQKNSGVSWDTDVLLTFNRYHSLSWTLIKAILFVSFVSRVSVTQSNFSKYNAGSIFTTTKYKLGVKNVISIRRSSFITVFNLALSTSSWTSLSALFVQLSAPAYINIVSSEHPVCVSVSVLAACAHSVILYGALVRARRNQPWWNAESWERLKAAKC